MMSPMRYRPHLSTLLLIASAQLVAPAEAATVRVATGGSDSAGCGSTASPCATLSYALDQVDGSGDVVELASGQYAFSTSVTVSTGGATGSPLIIRGTGPATILDGAGLSSGSVLQISAANVDLEDLALTGSVAAPLKIDGDHVRVRRVSVSAPRDASASCVSVNGASDVELEELSTASCPHRGVELIGGGDLRLLGGEVQSAGDDGVFAHGVSGLRVEGAYVHHNGLACSDCSGLSIDRCSGVVTSAWQGQRPLVITDHPGPGITLKDVFDAQVTHAILIANNGAIRIREGSVPSDLLLSVEHLTAVSSTSRAAYTDVASGTSLSVYNSVLAFNPQGDLPAGAVIDHGYNLRFDNAGSNLALDSTELDLDPGFADLAGQDLHLRSSGGRFLPGSGWVVDAEDSPAIDAADPVAPFALETAPSGGRANLGAHGNTVEASRSPGAAADAGHPDSALPDTVLPDTALPDTALPDNALPDTTGSDASTPDTRTLDAALALDAGGRDGAVAHDLVGRDLSALLANAGPDRRLRAPAEFWLDGSGSAAPPDARFSWSLVEGPGSPLELGEGTRVQVRLEQAGARIFELEISSGGASDRDRVLVDVWPAEAAGTAAGCSCAARTDSRHGDVVVVAGLIALGWRRRRARGPTRSR